MNAGGRALAPPSWAGETTTIGVCPAHVVVVRCRSPSWAGETTTIGVCPAQVVERPPTQARAPARGGRACSSLGVHAPKGAEPASASWSPPAGTRASPHSNATWAGETTTIGVCPAQVVVVRCRSPSWAGETTAIGVCPAQVVVVRCRSPSWAGETTTIGVCPARVGERPPTQARAPARGGRACSSLGVDAPKGAEPASASRPSAAGIAGASGNSAHDRPRSVVGRVAQGLRGARPRR